MTVSIYRGSPDKVLHRLKQGIIGCMVQLFYAWRIHALTRKIWIVVLIGICALTNACKFGPFLPSVFVRPSSLKICSRGTSLCCCDRVRSSVFAFSKVPGNRYMLAHERRGASCEATELNSDD